MFPFVLQRSLIHRRPPLSARVLHVLLVLAYLCAIVWGVATLVASRGGYSCTQWRGTASFGIWGMAYVGYGAVLLALALFITLVYARVTCFFHLARRQTSEMLLQQASAERALPPEGVERRSALDDGAASRLSSALEDVAQLTTATAAKLDARLSRYLAAYLVCTVPTIAHTIFIALYHYGVTDGTPFAVAILRWTLQPAQGAFNLLVYWNLPGGNNGCVGDCRDACHVRLVTRSTATTGLGNDD